MVFKKISLLGLVLTMGVLESDVAWTMERVDQEDGKPVVKPLSASEIQRLRVLKAMRERSQELAALSPLEREQEVLRKHQRNLSNILKDILTIPEETDSLFKGYDADLGRKKFRIEQYEQEIETMLGAEAIHSRFDALIKEQEEKKDEKKQKIRRYQGKPLQWKFGWLVALAHLEAYLEEVKSCLSGVEEDPFRLTLDNNIEFLKRKLDRKRNEIPVKSITDLRREDLQEGDRPLYSDLVEGELQKASFLDMNLESLFRDFLSSGDFGGVGDAEDLLAKLRVIKTLRGGIVSSVADLGLRERTDESRKKEEGKSPRISFQSNIKSGSSPLEVAQRQLEEQQRNFLRQVDIFLGLPSRDTEIQRMSEREVSSAPWYMEFCDRNMQELGRKLEIEIQANSAAVEKKEEAKRSVERSLREYESEPIQIKFAWFQALSQLSKRLGEIEATLKTPAASEGQSFLAEMYANIFALQTSLEDKIAAAEVKKVEDLRRLDFPDGETVYVKEVLEELAKEGTENAMDIGRLTASSLGGTYRSAGHLIRCFDQAKGLIDSLQAGLKNFVPPQEDQ